MEKTENRARRKNLTRGREGNQGYSFSNNPEIMEFFGYKPRERKYCADIFMPTKKQPKTVQTSGHLLKSYAVFAGTSSILPHLPAMVKTRCRECYQQIELSYVRANGSVRFGMAQKEKRRWAAPRGPLPLLPEHSGSTEGPKCCLWLKPL
jgi:hypothetical protein